VRSAALCLVLVNDRLRSCACALQQCIWCDQTTKARCPLLLERAQRGASPGRAGVRSRWRAISRVVIRCEAGYGLSGLRLIESGTPWSREWGDPAADSLELHVTRCHRQMGSFKSIQLVQFVPYPQEILDSPTLHSTSFYFFSTGANTTLGSQFCCFENIRHMSYRLMAGNVNFHSLGSSANHPQSAMLPQTAYDTDGLPVCPKHWVSTVLGSSDLPFFATHSTAHLRRGPQLYT
jgi:hypothetical protein